MSNCELRFIYGRRFSASRSSKFEVRNSSFPEIKLLRQRFEAEGQRRAQGRAGERIGEGASDRAVSAVVAAAREREEFGAEFGRFLCDVCLRPQDAGGVRGAGGGPECIRGLEEVGPHR